MGMSANLKKSGRLLKFFPFALHEVGCDLLWLILSFLTRECAHARVTAIVGFSLGRLVGCFGTQRQNECACSSPVSNLTRQNGGIFKIPIVCFRFAWISPNQNR